MRFGSQSKLVGLSGPSNGLDFRSEGGSLTQIEAACISARVVSRQGRAHKHRVVSLIPAKATSPVRSSASGRKGRFPAHNLLAGLPFEIQCQIFASLPQRDLLHLTVTSSGLVDAAKKVLYARPYFASTYRLAQFVTSISHSPRLASYVRELDLNLRLSMRPQGQPLAGWREWKWRSSPLYTLRVEDISALHNPPVSQLPESLRASHPLQCRLLSTFSRRDVPMGAILHILTACRNLRRVVLSSIPLTADYYVDCNKYKAEASAFTNLLFVSDVPKSQTWKEEEIREVKPEVHVVDALRRLPCLTEVGLECAVWLNREAAGRLVEMKSLRSIDLRGAGMERELEWAIRGSAQDLREIFDRS